MGQRFGHFEIERPLGVGGMAETAQALRRGVDGFQQHVCLKRILPAFGKDPQFVRAFQNEAKIAVRLVHPHICRIYDFGCHEGTWWMSMELVESGDLRSLFTRVERIGQPLPIDLVLQLAVDLASALHHAHAFRIDGRPAQIVHRDISPSNVLIDAAGHFKLADFGIAKATVSDEGATGSGTVKGKVPYMAPEHARGMKTDARADLWSFGVVLYEALAGKRPFRGASDVELLLNVAQGAYEPISAAAPHTPPVLQRVVEGLLTPDVDRRIQRAADVLEILAQSPPPATARLRLAELCQRIEEERHKSEERPIAEATTAFSPEGGTSVSEAEPTRMAQGGVVLGKASQPEHAAPEAPTRTAQASIPSMDTKLIASQVPATDPENAVPTGVREAFEIEHALQNAETIRNIDQLVGHPSSTPFAVERTEPKAAEAIPTTVRRPTAERDALTKIVAASAVVGIAGLGLIGWGVGLFDAAPRSAETIAAAARPAVLAPPPVAAPPPAPEPAPAPREVAIPAPTAEVAPAEIAPAEVAPAEVTPPEVVPAVAAAPPTPTEAPAPAPSSEPAAAVAETEERTAVARGLLVIGVVGFGNVWIDGRRVAEHTDHVERRVRAGRHTVAAGLDEPHETRTVEVVEGETLEVVLRAR